MVKRLKMLQWIIRDNFPKFANGKNMGIAQRLYGDLHEIFDQYL